MITYEQIEDAISKKQKMQYKTVSKDEFDAFIKSYPHEVRVHKSSFGADIYYDARFGSFSPENDTNCIAIHNWMYANSYSIPNVAL